MIGVGRMLFRSRGRLPLGDLANFSRWSRTRQLKFAAKSTLVFGSVATVAYFWPEIKFVGATISRSTRTAWTLMKCTVDYKRNYPFEEDQEKKDDEISEVDLLERKEKRSIVHRRAADRILKLFQKNGGIYIKLGQHIAALEHILPLEYSMTMSVLQNQAPTSSLEDVAAVIKEDLKGQTIEELFSEFDIIPLGAASLAQVHRGRLRENGKEVAIKVQHHRLQAFVDMDMVTVTTAVKLVKRIFPQFEFTWLADEMKSNLPKELDFTSEAHNSERVVQNLERTWPSNCPVYVPKIFWKFCSKRVLVMEYCPGAKITDVDWMKRNNLSSRKISNDLTKLYAQMIFLHGFVHCDPHPGNIFVRKDETKENGYSIILLDHGLYKELPKSFRLSYAHIWKALIDGNESKIKRYSMELGGGEAYKLFSAVLTHRSWDSMVGARDWDRPRNPVDVMKFRDKASEYLPQLAELLSKLPRPLLLLLKTNDLLRSIDRAIQKEDPGSPSETFLVMGKYCVEALNEERWNSSNGSIITISLALIHNLVSNLLFKWKEVSFEIYRMFIVMKS